MRSLESQVTVSPKLQETAVTYLATSGIPDVNLTQTGPVGTGVLANISLGFVTIKAVHEEVGTIFEQTSSLPQIHSASRILPSELFGTKHRFIQPIFFPRA